MQDSRITVYRIFKVLTIFLVCAGFAYRGRTALSKNLFSTAYLAGERTTSLVPPKEHDRGHFWLGWQAFERGDISQAINHQQETRQHTIYSQLLKANILATQGKTEEAADIWVKINSITQLNQFVNQALAASEFDTAEDVSNIFYQSNPEKFALDFSKFLWYDVGKTAQAKSILHQAIETYPNSMHQSIWLRQLSTYAKNEQDWETAAYFLSIIPNHELDPYALTELASLSLTQKAPIVEIEGYISKALAIDNTIGEAHYILGLAYKEDKSFETALIHFYRAVAINPENEFWHIELGKTLRANQQYSDAEVYFSQLVERHPNSAQYHYEWARSLYELGDLSRAKEAITQAIRLNTRSELRFYQAAGEIHQKIGEAEQAIYYYEQALLLDNSNAEVIDALKRLTQK